MSYQLNGVSISKYIDLTMDVPALKAVFPTVDVAEKRISVIREKLDEVAVWEE